MPGQSDENHDFTSSLKLLLNLYKWAISCNFSSPADEPDDRNCDSPREVRKTVATLALMFFFYLKIMKKKHSHITSRFKSEHVTSFVCKYMCRVRPGGCGGGQSPEWLSRLEIHTTSAGDREKNGSAAGRWRWERNRFLSVWIHRFTSIGFYFWSTVRTKCLSTPQSNAFWWTKHLYTNSSPDYVSFRNALVLQYTL